MRAAGYGDRVYGRAVSRAAGRGCSTGSSTTTTRRTCSGSACTRATGSSSRSHSIPTARRRRDLRPARRQRALRVEPGAEDPAGRRSSTSRSPRMRRTSRRASPARLLPDDYHRGDGYRVRPALEVVTPSTPFMAWRGKWGASSSSPVAPRRQGKWGDPGGFEPLRPPARCRAARRPRRAGRRLSRAARRGCASRAAARRRRYRFPPRGGGPHPAGQRHAGRRARRRDGPPHPRRAARARSARGTRSGRPACAGERVLPTRYAQPRHRASRPLSVRRSCRCSRCRRPVRDVAGLDRVRRALRGGLRRSAVAAGRATRRRLRRAAARGRRGARDRHPSRTPRTTGDGRSRTYLPGLGRAPRPVRVRSIPRRGRAGRPACRRQQTAIDDTKSADPPMTPSIASCFGSLQCGTSASRAGCR